MSRPELYSRLPEIWLRLDQDGVLDRYLGVVDNDFNRVHDKIKALFELSSVNEVPDKYLKLLGELVGHRWRSDRSYNWNRNRIRDSIRRWSYKGTLEALGDLIEEHGGGEWSVLDMASTIWVWSRQGRWSRGDMHYLAADYFHPGAFELSVSEQVDLEGLRADIASVVPAGEVWYFALGLRGMGVFETVYLTEIVVEVNGANRQISLWNEEHYWNYERQLGSEIKTEEIIWVGSTNLPVSVWGTDHYWNYERQLGCSLEVLREPQEIAVSGGTFTMDSLVFMDSEIITASSDHTSPLSEDIAAIQLPVERITEAL